jgi:hypothetical protein
MAIALFEDASPPPRSAAAAGLPVCVIDAKKLGIWIVGGAFCWAVIIGAVRLVVVALT